MPNRSDKRDAMALAASYSGIEFEWSDGVKGADIPAQAIPNGWAADESNATLGCWRAHSKHSWSLSLVLKSCMWVNLNGICFLRLSSACWD